MSRKNKLILNILVIVISSISIIGMFIYSRSSNKDSSTKEKQETQESSTPSANPTTQPGDQETTPTPKATTKTTATPKSTPKSTPTNQPTKSPTPTSAATNAPTATPSPSPTASPTAEPRYGRITSPNGSETLQQGSNYQITWVASSDITTIKLSYILSTSPDGGNYIVTNLTNTGSYNWNVSLPGITQTVQVKIQMEAHHSGGFFTDSSDNYFTVTPLQ